MAILLWFVAALLTVAMAASWMDPVGWQESAGFGVLAVVFAVSAWLASLGRRS